MQFLLLLLISAICALAATPDRITRTVDGSRRSALSGTVHRLAVAANDRGPVDSSMSLEHTVMLFQPSATQQAELDAYLADVQNPSSSNFRKWLTPEDYANRFGLSKSDQAKIAGWLTLQGLSVDETARSGGWMAFTGTVAQVSQALRTPFRRFEVQGKMHYSNSVNPSLPDEIGALTAGFIGLHDFRLRSNAHAARPNFTSGGFHYLAPEDFSTIYNVAPLYQAGLDGTGQNIAIVGDTALVLSDLRSFRTRFNLPASDPRVIFAGGVNPGVNDDLIEANLDLEWAGALAPRAMLTYLYAQDVFAAVLTAVDRNVAPIISISYGGCEAFGPAFAPAFRSVMQQANAQGITIIAASGDSGAAGCDASGSDPQAAHGRRVGFPAVLPEITAMGGTQFNDTGGTYWRATNTANGGSALSYIPEAAWNESDDSGLISAGGGVSQIYPKPAWQRAPGVPEENFRAVPDISLNASVDIPYLVYYQGGLNGVGGTSAGTPSFAAIVALLNQALIKNGTINKAGLGNINSQLYRLAQAAPSAFHDVTAGSNRASCIQGSVDCLTGFVGYAAAPGYDLATGLGSIDAANFVNAWTSANQPVTVSLSPTAARGTLNDKISITVTVTAPGSDSAPTGNIDLSAGYLPFGSYPLVPSGSSSSTAVVAIPAGRLGIGSFTVAASYSGNAVFNAGGATSTLQVVAPANAAAITISGPTEIYPAVSKEVLGEVFQTTITLRESSGVPAVISGFTIDGVAQPVGQYFPSPNLPANGTLTTIINFRNLSTPSTKTFGITGIDARGVVWSREITVSYSQAIPYDDFSLTAFPSTITQDLSNPSCQWPVRLGIHDIGGYTHTVTDLYLSDVFFTDKITAIFGTPRLRALGSLRGTLCLNNAIPGPATVLVGVDNTIAHEIKVNLVAAPVNPAKLSVTPSSVALTAGSGTSATATIAVSLSDPNQTWTAMISPANRTTGWLTVSTLAGTGQGQIMLTAAGDGFEPGAYRAVVSIQSPGGVPGVVEIPVIFVYTGTASATTISAVGNAAAPGQPVLSPGMLLTVIGTNLSNTTQTSKTIPLPYAADGVSVQVNGYQAPVLFISPTQLNVQVPYEAGAGPGVLGVNNNGAIAGIPVQIAPAAPGIFVDAIGAVVPANTVFQDGTVTVYLTGSGEVNTLIANGDAPSLRTATTALPKPVLPLSATIGGVPVFVQFAGIAPGLVGVMQVNLIVPQSVPLGVQEVVVTVNGVSSSGAKILVTPPK